MSSKSVGTKSISAKSVKKNRPTKPLELTQPFVVGTAYFIRTVTYHLVGRVKSIVGQFLVLEDAAWVADSGRFTQAIETGTLNEVEPVTVPVIVNMGSITDAPEWRHDLPRTQK